MAEMNEAQKKRYEEIREWLKNILNMAGDPAETISFAEFWSAQILDDPRIAILDEDQELPENPYFGIYYKAQQDMLWSNFRRVLPKGDVK